MRREYKFIIENEKLPGLRRSLQPYVELDPLTGNIQHDRINEYTVRTIYFDTPGFNDYREKEAGLRVRKKVRVRGYNREEPQSIVYLEIKRKNEDQIMKSRVPVSFSLLKQQWESRDFSPIGVEAGAFYYHIYRRALRPVVLITYEREAFFSRFNSSLRITFDKNLRCSSFYPSIGELFMDWPLEPFWESYCVLEIKFQSGFPQWLQHVVRVHDLQQSAVSKYEMAVDYLKMKRGFPVGMRTLPRMYGYMEE